MSSVSDITRAPGARRTTARSADVYRWLVLGLIALGAFLRFYRLGVQSLWVDEVLTIGSAEMGGRLGAAEFFGNVQGPLHALLVHLAALVSDSTPALRAISALAGTALIPVTYLLGKAMADKRVGVLAALFVTVSPFAVWYSQELRNYSLMMLLAAAASLFVWRAVTERGRSWVPYVVTMTLAVYCNLSAAFLAVAHGLFVLTRGLRDRRLWDPGLMRRGFTALFLVAALCVPLVWGLTSWAEKEDITEQATFAPSADHEELRRGETTFTMDAIPYSVFAMGYGFSLGPGLRELHTANPAAAMRDSVAVVGPAGALLAVTLVLGLVGMGRRHRGLAFSLLVMLVVAGGSVALALMNVKPMNPRYLAAAYPLIAVTLAVGVASVHRVVGGLLCAAIVVFCFASLSGYYFEPRYWKEDVRSAAYYVELHEEPGDIILVPVVRDVFNQYYDGAAERIVFYRGQAGSDAAVDERLDREVGDARRLWYVAARSWEVDPEGRIPARLEARGSLLDAADFIGVRVELYSLVGKLDARDGESGSPRDAVDVDVGPR